MRMILGGLLAGGVCLIVQRTPGYDSLTWFAGLFTGMAVIMIAMVRE